MKIHTYILIFVLLLSGCGNLNVQQSDIPIAPPAISVTITQNNCLSIEAEIGMTVAWTNGDSVVLPLAIEGLDANGNVVDKGTSEIGPGDTFSTQFMEAGIYRIYCSADREVYGTITVG